MKILKTICILFLLMVILSGCYSKTYVINGGNIIIKSTKSIPYDVKNYDNDELSTAIRVAGINVSDVENYVTKNRDATVTITYETLYVDYMNPDIFLIDIVDKNGNYPMIQDNRYFGDKSEKIQAKDIVLGFNTRKAHIRDSITFEINDIEKGEYNLLVKRGR